MKEVQLLYDEIQSRLKANQNPEYAVPMKQYMRNKFDCYGIQSPKRKEIISDFKPAFRSLNQGQMQRLVTLLWEEKHRESQYVGMLALDGNIKRYNESFIHFLESLITTKSWWDSVDWLAANGVGVHLQNYPKLRPVYPRKWIASSNIWLQRTAIIFQLKYKEETDFKMIKEFILQKVGIKEFFIQKACGWALRQHSRIDPDGVVQFVESHPELSTLCKTEALKWLKRKGKI